MPEAIPFRQKVDNFLTDYLRNTTTDQEILDFYGEGNIIGRKGIPDSREKLLDQVLSSRSENRPKLPHNFDAYDEYYGDKVPKHVYETIDMPANSPTTGRPWQMNFGKFPFPHEGEGTLAANQFLNDFRVPSRPVDYGFDIGPNILDRNEQDISNIIDSPSYYIGRQTQNKEGKFIKEKILAPGMQEKIEQIQNRQPGFLRPSGRPATPAWWEQEGYQLPANIKDATLNTFKETILQREGPFGSVSQLTPVRASSRELRPGGDPNWRANMYEKIGFAGPLFPQTLKTDRDVSSADVQSFVPGRNRLLPIQPYTEFFEGSAPSVVGKKPAPDFTPLQKTVGTRNYLIGKNILEGRGNLGVGFRAVSDVTGSIPLFDSGFRQAVEQGNVKEAVKRVGTEYITGAVAAPIAGLGLSAINQVSPRAAALVTGALNTGRIASPLAVVSQLGGSSRINKKFDETAANAQMLRAEAARKRGGKLKFPTPFGQVTIPEFGLSESGGLFFR